jgi:probable HAF family extracellular repeat protein
MSVRKSVKFVLGVGTVIAMLAGCGSQPQLPSSPSQSVPESHRGSATTVGNPMQGHRERDDSQYTLVDLGTFGGPQSYVSYGKLSDVAQILTNGGTVVGWADTSTPDPFPGFCFNTFVYGGSDCSLASALRWQNGAPTALPGLTQDSAAALAVNDNGLISGIAQNGQTDPLVPGFPELRAVLWHGQQIFNLGTFGGAESLAADINDQGQVAGYALNTTPDPYSFFGYFYQGTSNSTQTRAFVWQNNAMKDIGTLNGPDAEAEFINQRGQIAGDSYTNDVPNADGYPTDLPFLWTPGRGGNGTMQNLGTLGGDSINTDSGLNDQGEVIGSMFIAGDQSFHPYLWNGHRLIDLGTFGGPDGDTGAINNAGEVVGWESTTEYCPLLEPGGQLSFLWRNGVKTNLGAVPGTDNSDGYGINSRAQVVGDSFTCDASYFTVYLWEKGSMVDVNTLIPPNSALHLIHASAINDRGEIAGVGTLANGEVHAFVLIPNYKNKAGSRIGTTQGATVPRKVTPAEVAVFRAMIAHFHDSRMRHRHF